MATGGRFTVKVTPVGKQYASLEVKLGPKGRLMGRTLNPRSGWKAVKGKSALREALVVVRESLGFKEAEGADLTEALTEGENEES